MKLQAPQGLTSICVEEQTYTPDKKGLVEVLDEHGPKLLDFGFLPVDDSVILSDAPTQEDLDHFHKASAALVYIEAWNKDHPEAPIGPDAVELKAAYDEQNPKVEVKKVESVAEVIVEKAGE